jgi:hypothetical protein
MFVLISISAWPNFVSKARAYLWKLPKNPTLMAVLLGKADNVENTLAYFFPVSVSVYNISPWSNIIDESQGLSIISSLKYPPSLLTNGTNTLAYRGRAWLVKGKILFSMF